MPQREAAPWSPISATGTGRATIRPEGHKSHGGFQPSSAVPTDSVGEGSAWDFVPRGNVAGREQMPSSEWPDWSRASRRPLSLYGTVLPVTVPVGWVAVWM